ncbi:MAG: sulfatase-like hydrolase/transferase [Bacteroidota bacterium]
MWIVSEDNSAFLGCYGDSLANTPHIDAFAEQAILYKHAYANSPVCAPTRNTIITGLYANSAGNQHMRSNYPKSDLIKFLPEFLHERGYYCTNNAKEDYNTIKPNDVWDESSLQSNYKNKKKGQPFFHIQNIHDSHEKNIHKYIPDSLLKHRPERMKIPPYHPDTKAVRHDWAQYYDKISIMDSEVGKFLQELDDSGLAENTIVFYYSDHGGVLPRSKRFVYETGTHIPLIIRIPEKYKHLRPDANNGKVDRFVSTVDFAPTMLSLLDIPVPSYMQGTAFLGQQTGSSPKNVKMFRGRMDERYDMSRAVRDKNFRYIRNYMPHRIYAQHLGFLWRAASMKSWENEFLKGNCNEVQSLFWKTKPIEELYNIEVDPWEVNNLALDPNYKEDLERLREVNKSWLKDIKDAGFIPEAELIVRTDGKSAYDYIRSDKVEIEKIINVAHYATTKEADISSLLDYLNDDDSAIRYWAATGLLLKTDLPKDVIENLKRVLKDSSPSVSNVIAEILFKFGKHEIALKRLIANLNSPNQFSRVHTLSIIDAHNISDGRMKNAVYTMHVDHFEDIKSRYDLRLSQYLLDKWEMPLEDRFYLKSLSTDKFKVKH